MGAFDGYFPGRRNTPRAEPAGEQYVASVPSVTLTSDYSVESLDAAAHAAAAKGETHIYVPDSHARSSGIRVPVWYARALAEHLRGGGETH